MTHAKFGSDEFYGTYHGHTPILLEAVFEQLVAAPRRDGKKVRAVFLAGDSSMDNKYWIQERVKAVNGYEKLLRPSQSVPDIAYHLNHVFSEQGMPAVCINCAVEESTIGMRAKGTKLLQQDEFIRDHVTEDDVIICSVGGNDIALKPTAQTVVGIAWLSRCASSANVRQGTAWGLEHLRGLFGSDLSAYLRSLTQRKKPALVMPAVIYYPDMNPKSPSWASMVLKAIGYNTSPSVIQSVIDRVALDVKQAVTSSGVGAAAVVPVSLSLALDGTSSEDYVARVEPSAIGGAKIASLFVATLQEQGLV